MAYTAEQIKTFFGYLSRENLPIDFSQENIKGDVTFESLINKHFGVSIARLILCDEAIVDAPLRINGTPWEQAIAKWRMSLS